ncbi:MAG: hypothetical protein HZB50_00910 [Chloroflexi bacterium]|nr:hypothetical protein [Chloroflexota bacterium]
MIKNLRSIFIFFTVVSLACGFATNLLPSSTATNETPPAPNAQVDGFSAETNTDGSVYLKWDPINGAEQYLLEVMIGEEYLPLVTLPADKTSYEDKNAPASTQFTYRLSSLVNSEKGTSKEVTVETPQAAINPLQVTLELDQSAASLSIDPNTFDPSSIDPNNFDPSMFMPQPIQAKAIIGPQGGEVSVTGSNGVTYTLSVPPDALMFDIPITLKPVSGISDLPLSGGLMAAVIIEPESLAFDIPATLTMSPPADFPAPAMPLIMAFAFDANGQEFHLYPFDTTNGQSSAGIQLASLQSAPHFDKPQSPIAPVTNGGGYGKGNGTVDDANKIAQNSPSNPQDRTEQTLAEGQLDELAPLGNIANLKLGESIRQNAGKADDWGKLFETLDNFSTYVNAGSDKANKLTDKILDRLVDKAKKLLDKNKGKCLTKDDYLAQDLVERLTNPKDKTSKLLAERFKQKYGQKLLDDLANGNKSCSFKLTMKSNIITDGSGSFVMITANVTEMKLFLKYSQGDIYLTGTGKMNEKIEFEPEGPCGAVPITQYPDLDFQVLQLIPAFENDKLIDFRLSYDVNGMEKFEAINPSGLECLTGIGITGGGDLWLGQFNLARFLRGESGRIRDWSVPGNVADGNGFKAIWQSNVTPLKQSELTIIDDTKFELTVTQISR